MMGQYFVYEGEKHENIDTRRAQLPRLTREGEQVLLSAVRAPDPGESVLEKATVEIAPNLLVDEASPESTPALEAVLQLPLDLLEVSFEETIQRRRARIPRAVLGGAGRCHSDARRLLQRGGTISAWRTPRRPSRR